MSVDRNKRIGRAAAHCCLLARKQGRQESADRIAELEAKVERLRKALGIAVKALREYADPPATPATEAEEPATFALIQISKHVELDQ